MDGLKLRGQKNRLNDNWDFLHKTIRKQQTYNEIVKKLTPSAIAPSVPLTWQSVPAPVATLSPLNLHTNDDQRPTTYLQFSPAATITNVDTSSTTISPLQNAQAASRICAELDLELVNSLKVEKTDVDAEETLKNQTNDHSSVCRTFANLVESKMLKMSTSEAMEFQKIFNEKMDSSVAR